MADRCSDPLNPPTVWVAARTVGTAERERLHVQATFDDELTGVGSDNSHRVTWGIRSSGADVVSIVSAFTSSIGPAGSAPVMPLGRPVVPDE